jgi:hypothetical protein
LNAGFDVDGFIARIDSGEIDQTQHCGQNVSDLEDGQPVAEAAVFSAAKGYVLLGGGALLQEPFRSKRFRVVVEVRMPVHGLDDRQD